ncbi:MAG: 2,3-bisphosphoglycerate-independent phosphoglycerate mutase [Chloroflexota bacterium]
MFLSSLVQATPSKIVFLIIDGLGGLPHPKSGRTELETAHTPNLDSLAAQGSLGLTQPVGPGITPGSAPGHLALFGYDPVELDIGRGVMEALGVDFPMLKGDVAARGNFCTVDDQGLISDRRAGRIATEKNIELCQLLSPISLKGGEVYIKPLKEHRFVAVFRGHGLMGEVSDSDPQKAGLPPLPVTSLSTQSEATARLANAFIAQARAKLAAHSPANMVLLRGFSQLPIIPSLKERFQLHGVAIASYPMYRGLAKLMGLETIACGSDMAEAFDSLASAFSNHNFFFLHIKEADLAGEDGDFDLKVKTIEEVDRHLPRLTALKPEVIVVTGDHSTPAVLKGHSWHPVPLLMSSAWCRPQGEVKFGEAACARGELGLLPATQVMPLAMAHALKLGKYGA